MHTTFTFCITLGRMYMWFIFCGKKKHLLTTQCVLCIMLTIREDNMKQYNSCPRSALKVRIIFYFPCRGGKNGKVKMSRYSLMICCNFHKMCFTLTSSTFRFLLENEAEL